MTSRRVDSIGPIGYGALGYAIGALVAGPPSVSAYLAALAAGVVVVPVTVRVLDHRARRALDRRRLPEVSARRRRRPLDNSPNIAA